MKRLFVIVAMTWSVITLSAQRIGAYITDTDGPFTNIRNAPKGKVIGKISTKQTVIVALENYTNGWWKLVGLPEDAEELQLHPVGVTDGWIKVKTSDGKYTGWIEDEWICDNPLTNCC